MKICYFSRVIRLLQTCERVGAGEVAVLGASLASGVLRGVGQGRGLRAGAGRGR